jgi:hypothetical protein
MAHAQDPSLFIISEPVGSGVAKEVAHRLADHGVRTFLGSLAPKGELNDTAMEALRASDAALLVFDDAAAHSRHIDRHLLVARQSGKPLIPLRVKETDEGLLRQELLDAQWVDWGDRDAAVTEIRRRALDYARAQRDEADGGSAAGALNAASADDAIGADRQRQSPHIQLLPTGSKGTEMGAGQARQKPRIEVLGAGSVAAAAPAASAGPGIAAPAPERVRPAAKIHRSRSRFMSPTALIAMLALVLIVGAIFYTSRQNSGDGTQTASKGAGSADYSTDITQTADASDAVAPALPTAEPGSFAPAPSPAPAPAQSPAPADQAEPQLPAIVTPQVRPVAAPQPREVAIAQVRPAAAPEREAPAATGGGGSGAATVRSFYSALSRGDGASAAQLVVPAKRQSGPLSGRQLSAYFSSFRRPLRVRGVTPVDGNTVRVSYDYVLGDGRLCQGNATVNLVQSGDRSLVSGIRTQGPC